ncbi:hypothetical protein QJS66_18250 [Kocuria rhizophila]|nr:hypothetical protein QJS66_18250 [Kocuria rhizophila]
MQREIGDRLAKGPAVRLSWTATPWWWTWTRTRPRTASRSRPNGRLRGLPGMGTTTSWTRRSWTSDLRASRRGSPRPAYREALDQASAHPIWRFAARSFPLPAGRRRTGAPAGRRHAVEGGVVPQRCSDGSGSTQPSRL